MTYRERLDDMLERYGEVVTKTRAARILGRSPSGIRNMIADGRLDAACGGTMVDVRSIAAYVAAPGLMQEVGRINRIRRRTGSQWAV
ncbi:MAG: hypothetical protein J6S60_03850 [Oscillospiraceae bacterium]|nr:hypothetical protein [Oscillospiraceae bacterium]